MKLYNTMTREIELVNSQHDPEIGLYACGPTVYDYAHLGHLRKYTLDDILVRTLRSTGLKVKFVQNITDVGHLVSDGDSGEDKMEKGAKKYHKSVWEIAREFEKHFFYSMDLMSNLRPDVSCRATDHIPEQLELVRRLEAKGFTYVIPEDGVYFDTGKLADYGKLARLDLEKLQAGARVEMVEGKRHPTDFALWKFERPGENRQMVWPSPWHERSFPGWHIECSAMSIKYLGEQFEIHTGGIDHIPVHHTNEIAQVEAATGKKPFVKIWVHHNFLTVEGEKMSKSLGNVFSIDDVIKRGYHPLALRLLYLTAHYRSEMNFTWDNLAGAHKSYHKLIDQFLSLGDVMDEVLGSAAADWLERFNELMTNDLKTPEAVALMWELLKSDLTDSEKRTLLLKIDQVLALGLNDAESIAQQLGGAKVDWSQLPDEVMQLLDQRSQARDDHDWDRADQLRHQLQSLGYEVTDQSNGEQQLSHYIKPNS